MDIVKDAQPKAAIVLQDGPSAVARYAANELQHHIKLATGVQLSILSEAEADSRHDLNFIYVGPSRASQQVGIEPGKLPLNAFTYRANDTAMFLVGNDGTGVPPLDDTTSMGSLFAVYHWLDEQLGVRWLWPGDTGTVVPQATEVVTGFSGDKVVLPSMLHSRLRIGFGADKMSEAARERYFRETNTWLRRQFIARPVSFDYGHAFGTFWDRYGKDHPEYFALRPDGVRAPVDERHNLVQMCVSNPGLQRQIIENWLVQRKQSPEKPWINGIEDDRRAIDPFCSCDACRALDAGASKTGEELADQSGTTKTLESPSAMSNRYARFWLALLEEGKKSDPNAKVIGYAYSDYAGPPTGVKLNENIIVGIVPHYRYPADKDEVARFRADWSGWKETGAQLYLRPNYFLGGYCVPYIFAKDFGDDFKYAIDHGLIATDFDSLTGMWGTQGPNLYVLGRLHARPDLSVTAILDEYYSGFGAAKSEIQQYFEFWDSVTKKCTTDFSTKSQGGWAFVSKAGDEIYTPETFQQGRAFLEKARLAAGSDKQVLARVDFLSVWLEHAELSMAALRAFHESQSDHANKSLKAAFQSARDEVDQFRQAHQEEFSAANVELLKQLERWSGWRPR